MISTISGHKIKKFYFVSNFLAKGLGEHKDVPDIFTEITWNRSNGLYFKSSIDESWDIDLCVVDGIHPEQRPNEKFLVNVQQDTELKLIIPEYKNYRIGEIAYTLDYCDVLCDMYPLFGIKH